ncbi:30S ribosomal protein S14 [Enterobacteriaceae bacterium ET-AT1-13]|nr:30S ribosomal protein S14 [Enterobacteriaceae bacterium ET-AT1-13]WGS66341.1 30S ribosomal protein S14 [Enterobacteriaceae bacterium Cmel17]WMC17364.1 MAG: 30S ribosomal protein S14 [Enterobacteriaceae bacterium Cmel21]WMC17571.1 MAG: 30S ribosomal protein S14 [Enterobacteriaceae bacterium PSmelAO3-2]WMC17776.1 MAG: 30S ribosomal protein S14 [Enterobacteriaceae bacterium PSmelAO3-1]WMC17979.1 MAG: 30S ribosomal protein S14 [Enterobacteriaceae bacterium PSmelAO1]
MSKKSLKIREIKKIKLINKFYNKRIKIKKKIKETLYSFKKKLNYIFKLQSLPRNSSLSRYSNRCVKTGRVRGYIGKFGLSRIKLRESAMSGDIPGLKKSSW